MKKIYLTLALLLTSAANTWSQSESRLMKVTTSNESTMIVNYNSEGKISQWTADSEGKVINTITYKTAEITQTVSENNSVDTLISKVENGKIVRETFKSSTYTFLYNRTTKFTYNASGQLTEAIQERNHGEPIRGELIWANGNITRLKYYEGSTLVGEIEYGYDTMPGNRYIHGNLSPISDLLFHISEVNPYAQIAEGYYGVHIKNNITSVKYIQHSSHDDFNADYNREISYVRNGDGTIRQLMQAGSKLITTEFEWSNTTTDIKKNISTAVQKETYYDINGKSINRLKKGVNIIKGSDKQVRKVIVR